MKRVPQEDMIAHFRRHPAPPMKVEIFARGRWSAGERRERLGTRRAVDALTRRRSWQGGVVRCRAGARQLGPGRTQPRGNLGTADSVCDRLRPRANIRRAARPDPSSGWAGFANRAADLHGGPPALSATLQQTMNLIHCPGDRPRRPGDLLSSSWPKPTWSSASTTRHGHYGPRFFDLSGTVVPVSRSRDGDSPPIRDFIVTVGRLTSRPHALHRGSAPHCPSSNHRDEFVDWVADPRIPAAARGHNGAVPRPGAPAAPLLTSAHEFPKPQAVLLQQYPSFTAARADTEQLHLGW